MAWVVWFVCLGFFVGFDFGFGFVVLFVVVWVFFGICWFGLVGWVLVLILFITYEAPCQAAVPTSYDFIGCPESFSCSLNESRHSPFYACLHIIWKSLLKLNFSASQEGIHKQYCVLGS